MAVSGEIVAALTRPHTVAFILSVALFWATLDFPYLAMWFRFEWLDKYSGMYYAMLWLQTMLGHAMHVVLVIGIFWWWAERRLAGRPAEVDGRMIEKPVTFVYVVALATVMAVHMVTSDVLLKFGRWIVNVPNEWIHLPLWVVGHYLIFSGWDDVFLIGVLGWMVEKRIGSLGMAMISFPLTAGLLAAQVAFGLHASGLSGVTFPLMGATALLVPWVRIPVPFTDRFLPFPLFALFALVVAVDIWNSWDSVAFLLLYRWDTRMFYHLATVISAHTVGALLGLAVAAYFRAKSRPRLGLKGQHVGVGATAPARACAR